MKIDLELFKNTEEPAWCPGCGNFRILNGVKQALVDLEIPPHRAVVVTGIGQAAKLPHYMRVNTFNGLHGREVAHATGVKLAAPDLTVVVNAGDGGAYGEGGNHLLHAIRRNINITLLVHDNHYYGLTKGQLSPTAQMGTITKVHPDGGLSLPLNPLALAISQSCSFVAQASAAHEEHLAQTIAAGIRNRGFSLINVLQPCVTYDKKYTFQYYKEHCYTLGDDWNSEDRDAAFDLSMKGNYGEEIPIGVIYRREQPTFEDVYSDGKGLSPLRDCGIDQQHTQELMKRFR